MHFSRASVRTLDSVLDLLVAPLDASARASASTARGLNAAWAEWAWVRTCGAFPPASTTEMSVSAGLAPVPIDSAGDSTESMRLRYLANPVAPFTTWEKRGKKPRCRGGGQGDYFKGNDKKETGPLSPTPPACVASVPGTSTPPATQRPAPPPRPPARTRLVFQFPGLRLSGEQRGEALPAGVRQGDGMRVYSELLHDGRVADGPRPAFCPVGGVTVWLK